MEVNIEEIISKVMNNRTFLEDTFDAKKHNFQRDSE